MPQTGKIKLRDLRELQNKDVVISNNSLTPLSKKKYIKSSTTSKKLKKQLKFDDTVIHDDCSTTTNIKKTRKNNKSLKSAIKETPSNQRRIDSYFTSCPKKYQVKCELPTTIRKPAAQITVSKSKGTDKRKSKITIRSRVRRKRLFSDTTEPFTENMSVSTTTKETDKSNVLQCITIDSDSDDEVNIKKRVVGSTNEIDDAKTASVPGSVVRIEPVDIVSRSSIKSYHPTPSSSIGFGRKMSKTSCEETNFSLTTSSNLITASKRKKKPCPPYKIIENTTFAVDAFQFGYIESVTHYFLTHFHADHYIGLTKSFSMPLYMSPITARLVREFIKVEEMYINVLELNQPTIINGIKVTALDANHCPGSILLVFECQNTEKCILHTGDFRACHEMESEPIFWNKDIHTIYLDTTYISDKYAFCSQHESIIKTQNLIDKFLEKHAGKRILYICGSYIVGKEKFWASLAEKYEMKVWAEGNRYKALKAINEERLNRLLVDDPNEANMHVISMGKISYLNLVEYAKLYEQQYDVFFAMRPSGWEKDNKPHYGKKINMVGIEYSEHSSYEEMKRFVKFLKPKQVISTVPSSKDLFTTAKVPISWYKYKELKPYSNYQPSIDSFLPQTPKNKYFRRCTNVNLSGLDNFVSPLKSKDSTLNEMSSILENKKAVSVISSESNEAYQKLNNPKKCLEENKKTARTTPVVLNTNSSDDFEESSFVTTTKQFQRNQKQNKINKTKTKSVTKKKKELLKQKDTTSIELVDRHIETKTRVKKNITINESITDDKISNINSILHSSEDNVSNFQQKYKDKISTSEQIITRSKSAKNNPGETSSSGQSKAEKDFVINYPKQATEKNKALKTKSKFYSTGPESNFRKKLINNSTTNSTLTDELQTNNQLHSGILVSQRKMTRSKRALADTTSNSVISQIKIDRELENELYTIAEQDDKIINSKVECSTKYKRILGNPLLKTPTESTVNLTSINNMQIRPVTTTENNMKSPSNSKNRLDEFDYNNKSLIRKRHALNHTVTPLKKVKPSTYSQAIVKKILDQREDINRFNCSQLASLVVETVNKQNPDHSKDHIPTDLLSDSDDGWM